MNTYPVDALTPYKRNARRHEAADVQTIANSITEFEMCDPIGIWGDKNIIVEGHGRVLALKQLGRTQAPCIRLDHLTDEQRRAYALAHNKTAEMSSWDFDKVAAEIANIEINMQQFGFDLDGVEIDVVEETPTGGGLCEKFIVPPFSILDTRQGYWQDRKRAWKDLGLQSEAGRKEGLLGSGLKQLNEKFFGGNDALNGTSIFDPVLCEIVYKWFGTENGKIYDCFAGGSVRGVVAAKLNYEYHGIDLRKEQIEANRQNALQIGVAPNWYCDDSLNADKYIKDNSVDLVFSCPPYADLEVYSDDPRDISNMQYEEFCKVYAEIISIACRKLKNDRFAVFVVGDVRDKKGFYRNFVDYTKKCFNENGLQTYNELILVEQIATAAMRANRTFSALRKCIKTHQNVLVFYKGSPENIKINFNKIQIDDSLFET